jgi:hypothetical protein
MSSDLQATYDALHRDERRSRNFRALVREWTSVQGTPRTPKAPPKGRTTRRKARRLEALRHVLATHPEVKPTSIKATYYRGRETPGGMLRALLQPDYPDCPGSLRRDLAEVRKMLG